jgi:hypothetical protein
VTRPFGLRNFVKPVGWLCRVVAVGATKLTTVLFALVPGDMRPLFCIGMI